MPSMPSPAEQAGRVRGQRGPLVLRWMLGDGMRYEAARARFDHLYFQNLLRRSAGNVTEAARLAGISRGHLHRRMKELGVTP